MVNGKIRLDIAGLESFNHSLKYFFRFLHTEREWAVVNGNTKFCRSIRPISVELCELRSFRLSEDSNQVILSQIFVLRCICEVTLTTITSFVKSLIAEGAVRHFVSQI